jgi:hypothetical protein
VLKRGDQCFDRVALVLNQSIARVELGGVEVRGDREGRARVKHREVARQHGRGLV